MTRGRAIQGVVLAGGRSSRFGSDKAEACFKGKPLIRHAADLLRSAGLPVCVITQSGRDYSFLDCAVLFDREPYLGPLAGLARAFEEFPGRRILALTCDMPFLVNEDLQGLITGAESGDDEAVLYKVAKDYFQPFPGIYNSSLSGRAGYLCQEHKKSMQDFIKAMPCVREIAVATSAEHFKNINHPGALMAEYDTDHK